MLLYCGPYDPTQLLDPEGIQASPLWPFIDKILWAYLGTHDYAGVLELAAPFAAITSDFPASFISVGNDDPLKAHSTALAERLGELGVSHETLFYADDHTPALGHEYQFALTESEDAKRSLELSMEFITEQVALKQLRLLAVSEQTQESAPSLVP